MSFFDIDAGVKRDVTDLLLRKKRWLTLARSDISERYHRSKLGVFWASLSILIFVGAVSPIYAHLFGVDVKSYALHFMLGLMVWNFLFTIVMESTDAFIVSKDLLSSFGMGYTSLIARAVTRNLVVLGYQLMAFLVVTILLGNYPTISWLVAIPGLLVVVIVGFFLGLLISIIAARFRDFTELINNLLRLVFFATPVMWFPNLKPELQWIVHWNPWYYMIEWIRAPLTSSPLPELILVATTIIFVTTMLVSLLVLIKVRSRIAFWL